MGEDPLKDRLDALDVRLKGLRQQQTAETDHSDGAKTVSGYGFAFRIATDLLGGVIGGAGLGWLLDRWLGSSPLGLVILFFIGAIAGMWNVYRTARGYGSELGYARSTPTREGDSEGLKIPAEQRPKSKSGD